MYVVVNCWELLPDKNTMLAVLLPPLQWSDWHGVLLGAFIAFYAFVGFEDMVNIAEEVEQPEKSLPKAIIAALLVSVILYILIALVSVLVLPIESLSASDAPFADMLAQSSTGSVTLIAVISMVAVVNGALVQLIMCSRVIYGMARQGLLPKKLGLVSKKTRTPVLATVFSALFIVVFALALPLVVLAKITSFIVLLVFIVVNLALVRIQHITRVNIYPRFVPVVGFIVSLLFCLSWLLLA